MAIQDDINKLLAEKKVEVKFSRNALSDYRSYTEGMRRNIVALILRQALKKNSLLKPEGNGEPLYNELTGFAKIKPKALSLRIVYRATKLDNEIIRMEIIAIGPRDKEKVYQMAVERLVSFRKEMSE